MLGGEGAGTSGPEGDGAGELVAAGEGGAQSRSEPPLLQHAIEGVAWIEVSPGVLDTDDDSGLDPDSG